MSFQAEVLKKAGKGALALGLFVSVELLSDEETDMFCFYHFQQFFAANYMASLVGRRKGKLLKAVSTSSSLSFNRSIREIFVLKLMCASCFS